MPLKHLLPAFACAAILAGCATTESHPVTKPLTSAEAIEEADVAFSVGMPDKGVKLLKDAASAYPADKGPLLKLAQHQFNNRVYGEAVAGALAVLDLDQNDMQAHSIVAVAGLRLSLKALSDLTVKNNLSGTVKSEAKDLAKLLRTRLGEDLIADVRKTKETSRISRHDKVRTPAKEKDSADPFDALKN